HARGLANLVPPPPPACLSGRFRGSPEVCQPSIPPCIECLAVADLALPRSHSEGSPGSSTGGSERHFHASTFPLLGQSSSCVASLRLSDRRAPALGIPKRMAASLAPHSRVVGLARARRNFDQGAAPPRPRCVSTAR